MPIKEKIKKVLANPKVLIMKLKELKIQRFIANKCKENPNNFFFVQIGSNDGINGDPIHKFITKYKWKGILVEPVPEIFQKLKTTYKDYEGLVFENIAIATEEGYKDFYRVKENDEPNNPGWYTLLGSFNKDIVVKHRDRVPNLDKYLIKEKVKCMTFQDLLKKNNTKKINLLHIDTEGYDFEIIKTINFNEIKPRMILYENEHLSNIDKTTCINLLKKEGYKIIVNNGGDTFAYL